MSWTKRQIIDDAFDRIGLANYSYDIQPEQYQSAARKLDAMMATWNVKMRIGFPVSDNPDTIDIDQLTGVKDAAVEAICLNLSLRIAGSVGKVVSVDDKIYAKQAYNNLLLSDVEIIEMKLPKEMPSGSGNKPFAGITGVFIKEETDNLSSGSGTQLEF